MCNSSWHTPNRSLRWARHCKNVFCIRMVCELRRLVVHKRDEKCHVTTFVIPFSPPLLKSLLLDDVGGLMRGL